MILRLKLIIFALCLASFFADAALAGDASWRRGISVHPNWSAPRTSQADEAKYIKALGFDFVRLAVDPAGFMTGDNERALADRVSNVEAVLEAQLNVGLKVIVDFHAIPNSGSASWGTAEYLASDAAFAQYSHGAEMLARAVARHGAAVAFEPMNEPYVDCGAAAAKWPELALGLHKRLRLAAPHLTLMWEGGCWADAKSLSLLKPAAFDGNVIWTFHDYSPMIFSHQGASWVAGVPRYAQALPYPPRSKTKAEALQQSLVQIESTGKSEKAKAVLQRQMAAALGDYFMPTKLQQEMETSTRRVVAWAKAHKINPKQILVGEFGSMRGRNGSEPTEASRAAYLQAKRQIFEAAGFGWCLWELHGSFGLADGADREAEMLKALGLPAAPRK